VPSTQLQFEYTELALLACQHPMYTYWPVTEYRLDAKGSRPLLLDAAWRVSRCEPEGQPEAAAAQEEAGEDDSCRQESDPSEPSSR